MNVIFFTQSRSLDVFHQLLIRTKDRLGIDKSGFYVANKAHYEDFLTENPDFENQYLVLKEWEIYKEAQNHICNMDRISKYEIDIGDPTLWTPIVTDRRLYYGEKTTYRQDYKPYFNYYDQMSILDLALQRIDKFFNEIGPDLICTIYTATFGDCLGHQFAAAKGVKSLDLRLSRLKNYVMFVDGVEEPPPHISKIISNKNINSYTGKIDEAEQYIRDVLQTNAMYEGVVPAKRDKKDKKSFVGLQIISKTYNVLKNYKNYQYRNDPQIPNIFRSYLYKKLINPILFEHTRKVLRSSVIRQEEMGNNDYILYPLHTEPELVLAQFARPYLNQIEVIRNISLSCPLGKTVLVKEHPMMIGRRSVGFYKKILQIPNVKLVDFDVSSESVLKDAKMVVVIRGAIGLEAVIRKIPVVSLGRSMFELLPKQMFHTCSSLFELPQTINFMFNNYEYHHKALISYLAAVMAGSTAVNLVTDLLGKKGRYKEKTDEFAFEDHPHLDILAEYFIKRLDNISN